MNLQESNVTTTDFDDESQRIYNPVEQFNNLESEDFHQLQNRWTLWFRISDITKDWSENLMKVADISTVEEFWSVTTSVTSPSNLPPSSDYFFFQEGIQPSWEDSQNKEGGQWVISFDKIERIRHLDSIWHELLLTVINDEMDAQTDYISGLVASVRNKYARIGVWLKGSASDEVVMEIGKRIRDKFRRDITRTFDYSLHCDVEQKQNSKPRTTFNV